MHLARATAMLMFVAAGACGEDECLSGPSEMPPGELVWEQAFAGAGANAIAVDRCNVAVAGYQAHTEGTDLWVGALTSAGRPLWHRRIHELFFEVAAAVAFDGEGALLVAGTTDLGPYVGSDVEAGWLARFEPDAEFAETWRQHAPAEDERESINFSAVTTGPDGRALSAGTRLTRFGRYFAVVQAHDADGKVAWTHERGEDGSSWLRDAFVLPGGDVMFAGWHYTHGSERVESVLLLRLTAAGMPVSERLITDLLDASSSDTALAGDGTALFISSRGWLRELTLDGVIVRETPLDAAEIADDIAAGVDGEIYVAGRRELDTGMEVPWLARFDPGLVRVWDHVGDRRGSVDAVAVGPGGDPFIVGSVEAPPRGMASVFANYDLWVARFAR